MTGGTLRAMASAKLRGSIGTTTKAAPPAVASEVSLTYGTGPGRVDILVARTRGLDAGESETIDLFAGAALLDLFDDATPLRTIKFIEILVASGGDESGVLVGGAAPDCWAGFFADATDKAVIFPGGPGYRGGSPAGVAVTAAARNLKVENLGAVAVTYTVVIGGGAALGGAVMGVLGLTYP